MCNSDNGTTRRRGPAIIALCLVPFDLSTLPELWCSPCTIIQDVRFLETGQDRSWPRELRFISGYTIFAVGHLNLWPAIICRRLGQMSNSLVESSKHDSKIWNATRMGSASPHGTETLFSSANWAINWVSLAHSPALSGENENKCLFANAFYRWKKLLEANACSPVCPLHANFRHSVTAPFTKEWRI